MSRQRDGGSLFHQFRHEESLFIYANRQGYVTSGTGKNYLNTLHHAAEHFKSEGFKKMADIKIEDVQRYADKMVDDGRPADTVHTYLVPLCKVLHIPLDKIEKPIRHAAYATKGIKSKEKGVDGKKAAEFNSMVGLRIDELFSLRKCDLVEINGITYVRPGRTKGGKNVYQKILPQYVDKVKAYFDGSKNWVFIKGKEINRNYAYHRDRREVAHIAYNYYLDLCKTPEGRLALYNELAQYYHKYKDKGSKDLEPKAFFRKPYILRGANRQLAIEQGRPYILDSLALRAVSVLHLAHWRDDVTVGRYMVNR